MPVINIFLVQTTNGMTNAFKIHLMELSVEYLGSRFTTLMDSWIILSAQSAVASWVQFATTMTKIFHLTSDYFQEKAMISWLQSQWSGDWLLAGWRNNQANRSLCRLLCQRQNRNDDKKWDEIDGTIEDVVSQTEKINACIKGVSSELFLPYVFTGVWKKLSNFSLLLESNMRISYIYKYACLSFVCNDGNAGLFVSW